MKKFIAGMAFACLMDPALTLITHLTEWAKSTISIKIVENNVKIKSLDTTSMPEESAPARVIGFSIPSNEGEYEDEE